MDANDLERLTQRIAKLESFNRRLSRIVVVLLVVLASAGLFVATRDDIRKIFHM